MKEPRRPVCAVLLHGGQQWLGSAAVQERVALGLFQEAFEIEQTSFILWPGSDSITVFRGEVGCKSHGCSCSPAVQQGPIAACTLSRLDHCNYWGDTDTASDEAVAGGLDKWEIVARAAYSYGCPCVESFMDKVRPPPRIGVEKDADSPCF
ncbi:hypothetical protein AZG88_37785 [Rhodococcus sp. LB1]|nr:hypothetical protein AZG88_37785 [Rhodococcus sp. LB1]